MTLTLWHLDASPPARAVRILADLLGVELELKAIDFIAKEHKSPEFMKINPLGTVPVFKDGDFVLTDSHAIMKYLLEKFGGEQKEKLYPSELRTRALIDQSLFFDTGVFFIRLKAVALPTIYSGLAGPSARHRADIEAAFAAVEAYLGDKPFLAAARLTLADISVGVTALMIQTIHKLDDNKYPKTAAWLKRLQEVPAFRDNTDTGFKILSQFYNMCWAKNKEQQQ